MALEISKRTLHNPDYRIIGTRVANMPVVSTFYGIIIRMHFKDDDRHHAPHIHAHYQSQSAVVRIPDGKILAGRIPKKKMTQVQEWVEKYKRELMLDWDCAVKEGYTFRIEPLK